MKENVKKVLEAAPLWYIATCSEELNVVPVGLKMVLEDGKLAVGDVFMNYTKANVQANGKIAVCAHAPDLNECYQIKGTAEYVTEGSVFEMISKMAEVAFNGAAQIKGTLVITPEKAVVATAGPDNNKIF